MYSVKGSLADWSAIFGCNAKKICSSAEKLAFCMLSTGVCRVRHHFGRFAQFAPL